MPVTLLKVDDHFSLEFEESDLKRIGRCIGTMYPDANSRPDGIFKVYTFGGCEFAFQNEWDDPCLVSDSNDGDAILRMLHARLQSFR